jgi:hypothetical protein
LWVALVAVVAGSFRGAPDYWTAAPWILIGAVPVCALTLATAAVTYGVHSATGKLRYAAACFALLVTAVAITVAVRFNRYTAEQVDLEADQQAGRALVAETSPAGFEVSLSSSRLDADGEPVRFVYYVSSLEHPNGGVMAIVNVSPAEPRLRIACVLPEAAYEAVLVGDDPCRAVETR